MKLREIMKTTPTTVAPHDDLRSAREVMREQQIRHLPVIDAGRIVGILSDRDIALYTESRGESIWSGGEHLVSAAMQTEVLTAGPDDLLAVAVNRMASEKIGCLPVVDNDVLVGIVTTTDVLQAHAKEL